MRIITSLIFFISISCQAENYLCVADKATGFQFSKSNWEVANFKTDNKYLVKVSDLENFPYQVSKIGNNIPVIMCRQSFNSGGFLHCDSGGPLDMLSINLGEHFSLNQKSLRFMRVVPRGYINVVPGNNISDPSSGTPYIEIGKCSQI
jgi:hypothetical protein